ncbi:MAG: hypothetical protein EOM90_01800 [Alphaproteobacteria bacterium]|nr:hypothetical protein [Alphaproteobacteria bacterium]
MVKFTANRLQVIQTLKCLKTALNKNRTKSGITNCELTVTSTKVTFAIPGALFSLPCTASGAAKAIFPFMPFLKLINLESRDQIEMTFTPSSAALGNFTFHAETCFFTDDRILRTIQLPMNYTLIDLVNLNDGTYTQEELEFNRIPQKTAEAAAGLDEAIRSCYNKLKSYGIRLNDIEEFVKSKIYHLRY